jgi:hypothetical protein
MARGFTLLGDDTVLLERSLLVRPMPFAPAIKAGAWTLLAPYHPALSDRPIHVRPDAKKVRYLRPCEVAGESLPAAWLVFADWRRDTTPPLAALARSEALRRLLACCYAPARALSEDDVARLVTWMGGLACHTLATGDLAAALDALDRLCR